MQKELKQVLLAKVYDVAIETPLEKAQKLSQKLGSTIYYKREDLQPVHSFKLRGAYNKIANLTSTEMRRGVIAASAGNHAQGVAMAARKLGLSAMIVMPLTTPAIKVDAVKAMGAEVELVGDSYSDAATYCKQRVIDTGRTFIHPFDDPLVIAGQGTVGREIIEQLPQVTHIFVPVGGGGLIAGVAQYVKAIRPGVKVIGVQPEDSNALYLSMKLGHRVELDHVGIFADGVAVKKIGNNTFRIAQKVVDEVICVNTDQVCAGIKHVFEDTRSIVEPAGALAAAGVCEYSKKHSLDHASVVVINSGANMTFERLQFIAERTLLGSGKESLYSVVMPEQPGALQTFCQQVVDENNITQFAYRLNGRALATICVGIGIKSSRDKTAFEHKLETHKYKFDDLSSDDIAKEHIRHMIGGLSFNAKNEHFYEIKFPERPGALNDFLVTVSGQYNISLFHYRGQGGDKGSVLIGFEATDCQMLQRDLTNSRYIWQKIDRNKSLRAFIK